MKPELPPAKVMIAEFAESAKDIISQMITKGVIKASDEKAEMRVSLCRDCEFYVIDLHRCGKCGCFLKSKVWLDATKCPIGKW